ncbi:MAG TPA: UDP-N-acetylglucosamine 2-epimerase (non-hydrolyzing) [Streptosporangiaceae bacterium]|nr:UDP-N-acetylglucosamine 2-epimerase (non-hydrolyzing) [Streptosporangiaceae bacterium]
MTVLNAAAGLSLTGPPAPIRLLVIFGTRPEIIKLAPVVRALETDPRFTPVVCSTGQHKEMLDQMLDTLQLAPDYQLRLMRDRQTLSSLTSLAVKELGDVIQFEKPAAVLVQGDTTTCFCGALAAFYEGIPVAHVEAGLRSGHLRNPFPEELNRRLVAQMARWHFAPTQRAASNLHREGMDAATVAVTGNTGIDNLHWVLEHGLGNPRFRTRLRRVLVTLHRRENQGETMRGLANAVNRLADRGDVEVLLPLHKSPAVRAAIGPILSDKQNITLTEPLGYLDFTASLAEADLVLTDSGGIQEEAPSFGKPVLVLRETTERPEAIEAGVARLVGTNPDAVYRAAAQLLDNADEYSAMAQAVSPFGDGHAAARIVSRLAADLAAPSLASAPALSR